MGKFIFFLMAVLDRGRILSLFQKPWCSSLSAVVLGTTATLGFAPYDIWPITFAATVFFLLLLSVKNSCKSVFVTALLFFGALNFVTLNWLNFVMEGFGQMPFWLSNAVLLLFAAYLSLPYAALFALAKKLSLNRPGAFLLCFIPAATIAADFFVGWFLTGFPWMYLGYVCIDGPLKNYAPLLGVRGVTAVFMICAASCALAAKRRFLYLPVAGVLLMFGILTEGVSYVQRIDPVKVSLVQGNIPQMVKRDPSQFGNILDIYWGLSKSELAAGRMVVWPESALPITIEQGYSLLEALNTVAYEGKSTLITGILRFTPDKKSAYNSIVVLGKNKELAPKDQLEPYDKRALVPFGEIIPFEKTLSKMGKIFTIPTESFTYGNQKQQPIVADNLIFAPAICYESIFPELISSFEDYGTNGIMMLSIDTWFGPTRAPYQHLNIARMRSLELQKPMLRATNDGFTAYIDEHGVIVKTIDRDREGILRTDFYPVKGSSVYAKCGNLGVIVLGIALFVLGLALRKRRLDDNAEKLQELVRP